MLPFSYGVERFEPKRAAAMMLLNASIFHAAPAWVDHWCWTSSICVASYTPPMSTFPCAAISASVPRIGPDVITGEHTGMRFSAEASERDIAWTSFRLRPGQKYGRTRVPSASADHPDDVRPDSATTGLSHSPWKLTAYSAAISPDAMVNMTF